jgi:hypothetical protein
MKENPSSDIHPAPPDTQHTPLPFMETQISLVHSKDFVILEACQPMFAVRKKTWFQARQFYITSLQRRLVRFSTEMWSGQDFSSERE